MWLSPLIHSMFYETEVREAEWTVVMGWKNLWVRETKAAGRNICSPTSLLGLTKTPSLLCVAGESELTVAPKNPWCDGPTIVLEEAGHYYTISEVVLIKQAGNNYY